MSKILLLMLFIVQIVLSDTVEKLNFLISPYLQLPTSSSMTVRFEPSIIKNKIFKVYYKRSNSNNSYKYINVEDENYTFTYNKETRTVYFKYATIGALLENTRYDYFIESMDTKTNEIYTSPKYHFTTYLKNGDSSKFSFLALSDTQVTRATNFEHTYGVLRGITNGVINHICHNDASQCDKYLRAISISGDVVDMGGDIAMWKTDFFDQLSKITPYIPIIPATGNHEYGGDFELRTYRAMFMLPTNGNNTYKERYYDLKIGNMHMISLDSSPASHTRGLYDEKYRMIQLNWLQQKLEMDRIDKDIDVVLSVFHHGCLMPFWKQGESIGSCEFVRALEDFTVDTKKITGHIFGHSHAYARGISRDIQHLWLNSASASGSRESLNVVEDQDNGYDYDTFSVASSQFGFSILTVNGEKKGSLSMRRYKANVSTDEDAITVQNFNKDYDDITLITIEGNNTIDFSPIHDYKKFMDLDNAYIEINPYDNFSINQVQWQISLTDYFDTSITTNIWGNITKKKNIWYTKNSDGKFIEVDTQINANIFKLELNKLNERYFGNDENRMWFKNDIVGGMDIELEYKESEYKDSRVRENILDLTSGRNYYWRARVRDENMNWSKWSEPAKFIIKNMIKEKSYISEPLIGYFLF